jgi:hypothetical protein
MYFLAKKLLWANLVMISIALIAYIIVLRCEPHALVYADTKTPISPRDVFYFTMITHSTVGYGDIIPHTELMRTAITIHILCLVIVNALVVMSTAGHVSDAEHTIEQTRRLVTRLSRAPE